MFTVYPFLLLNLTHWSLVLWLTVSVHDFSCLSPPRALFLSTITESADVKVIDFIIEKVKASEINEVEASQLVVIALNHVTVTREIIDKAKVCHF